MSLKELFAQNKNDIFKYVVGAIIVSAVGGTWSAMKFGFNKYEENHAADVRRDSLWRAKVERIFIYPSIDSSEHEVIKQRLLAQDTLNNHIVTTLQNHETRVQALETYFK